MVDGWQDAVEFAMNKDTETSMPRGQYTCCLISTPILEDLIEVFSSIWPFIGLLELLCQVQSIVLATLHIVFLTMLFVFLSPSNLSYRVPFFVHSICSLYAINFIRML